MTAAETGVPAGVCGVVVDGAVRSGESFVALALWGGIINRLTAGTVHAAVARRERLAAVRSGESKVALALRSLADSVAAACVGAR